MHNSNPRLPIRWQPSWSFVLVAILIIVVPVLWFGPWVPFLDAINFIGLDSYPPPFSYGPHQYYIFEFTYILPFVLSRLCIDFGIGVAAQVSLFYLAQALIFLGVIWQVLEHTVRDPWIRGIALWVGTLAFWDGLFIWGGPLAFSLSATLVALAAMLSIWEAANPARAAAGLLTVLIFLAVLSHPFALVFALPLCVLRLILLPATRGKSVGTIAFLLLYAVVIFHDSPEEPAGSLLPQLFGLQPREMLSHIPMLFTWNSEAVAHLLGIAPTALGWYFYLLGAIHLLGFLTAPVVAVLAKDSPALRLLAALDTAVAVIFFLALPVGRVITAWPQRVLAFNSWVTFAAGIACPIYLIFRCLQRPTGREFLFLSGAPRWRWILAVLLIPGLLKVEVPILRCGPIIPKEWMEIRQTILNTGLRNVMLYPEFVDVHPYYRRCIPFLLFSDHFLIDRDIQVFTEWSAQPRHPSRTVDTGKPHCRLLFSLGENGKLIAQIFPDL